VKAIVHTEYGSFDTLRYGDAEKPAPSDGQVLVRVHAAAINAGNMFMVSGTPFLSRLSSGLTRPKYLNPGSDVAGRVEAVGTSVTKFRPGDAVYGDNLPGGCGTYAEYVCVPEDELALKPANLDTNGFYDITRVTLAVGHMAELFPQVLGNGRKWGMRIDYARETNKKLIVKAGCDPDDIHNSGFIMGHPSGKPTQGGQLDGVFHLCMH